MTKRILVLALGTMLVGSMSFAADQKSDEQDSSKTSTNMMGTKTTTKKMKKDVKAKNGDTSKVDVTEKTKVKKDGSVEKSVSAKGEASEPAAGK
jgi:hypothetical protein